MTNCEICEIENLNECKNCYLGNPCLGCIHYKDDDCDGQCLAKYEEGCEVFNEVD